MKLTDVAGSQQLASSGAFWACLSFLTRARASPGSLQPVGLRREAAEETGSGFRFAVLCGPGVVSDLTACRLG